MYRVLIADDERKVRETVLDMIEWERLGLTFLGETSNGDDLCELIDHSPPDIVLIDMKMPGKSGVELIRHIAGLPGNTKVIVISGYDDFLYLKEAINSRVTGYLLKPVDEAELNNTLEKAVTELSRESGEKRRELLNRYITQKSETILKAQKFWALLQDDTVSQAKLEDCLDDSLPENHAFSLCVLEFENLWEVCRFNFQSQLSLLLYGIENIAGEYLAGSGKCFCDGKSLSVVLLLYQEERIKEKITGLLHALHDCLSLRGIAGISSTDGDCSALKRKYAEASYAAAHVNLQGQIYVADFVQGETPENFPETDLELMQGAEREGPDTLYRMIEDRYRSMEQTGEVTIAQLEHLWKSVSNILMHADFLKEQKAQIQLYHLDSELRNNYLIPSILDRLKGFFSQFENIQKKTGDQLANEIKDYIDRNYNRDLSGNALIDQFHISRPYLFKLFKEKFHISPHIYILNRKVEKSKVLLLNPEMKTGEIVDLLNFTDESHFSRVFKRIAGCSPSQYRTKFTKG